MSRTPRNNDNPQVTRTLVGRGAFEDDPLFVVDVGASGGIDGYRAAADRYPARVIAMSVFASGGIPARDAIEWVTAEPYVKSIVFGASSRANIESTVALIREFDELRA